MLEGGGQPGIGTMAEFAVIRTRNMVSIFAFGDDAIVTTETTAAYFVVVHAQQRGPPGSAVATGTLAGGA